MYNLFLLNIDKKWVKGLVLDKMKQRDIKYKRATFTNVEEDIDKLEMMYWNCDNECVSTVVAVSGSG